MSTQKLAFRPVPLQSSQSATPQNAPRCRPSSPASSSTSSSSKRQLTSVEDSDDDEDDDSAESDGEDVEPRVLMRLRMRLQQQRLDRVANSDALQAPAGVQRASRMAAARCPTIGAKEQAFGTRAEVLKSLGLDSNDAQSIPYEELVQMCQTRHQKQGRTGWQRGSGLRIADPEERRTGERCVLLRTNLALAYNLGWVCPQEPAPYKHSELLDACFHGNALANGRTKRGKREGASTQVSRIDKSRVSRSEAAACSATMIELALARDAMRQKGRLVLSPFASNAFDLGGALAVTSTAREVIVVGSALLPYNCMPVQLATGDAYDAARMIAQAQLSDRAITVALGNLSTHLDDVCLSVANPDHVNAEFDCCWAAIVLMAHLSQHPRGIALISELAPTMTNFQLERMRSLESYGRAEILRRINQANREFNKRQKDGGGAAGNGARKAARVAKAEEEPAALDEMPNDLIADRSTLGDGVSDMRFWTWALRSPHASCLATLVAGSEDTARDAAMRTLHKQAPGSNILYNKIVTDAAEDHAVSVNAEMDGVVLRREQKKSIGPVPRFVRFLAAVTEEQKQIAECVDHKRVSILSGQDISCCVVEAFGIEKLPDDAGIAMVHVARRVTADHPTPPCGHLAAQRIAILHSLASRPLRPSNDPSCLPAFCERTAIRRSVLLGTQDERRGSTFGTGKGKLAAETARVERQLGLSNTDDTSKMLLTRATGLTRSWISTRTFFTRSELEGLTSGKLISNAVDDAEGLASNSSSSTTFSSIAAESVARGGGCVPIGKRVVIHGDPGQRGRMQHPAATRQGLMLRIDQVVRKAFRQTPNPTQRSARPCRTMMIEPVRLGPMMVNDAPVDHYAPLPFAPLCEADVEFDGDCWQDSPARMFEPPNESDDPSQEYVPAIAWKQICADGAVRIVDVVARGMRMRQGEYTLDAEAGADQTDADKEDFEREEEIWKRTIRFDREEGGEEICYDDITRGLAHLLLGAASQASLISDFGESIAGQHMIVFVANSRGVRVPDNCYVANLTVYDALYAHRTGLEPQCIGTRYEGQYGAIYDDGRCSMGIAAHNHVSDNRLHGSGHLSQSLSDACAVRLGSREYAMHYTKDGVPVHRPPEACGEPHGLIPGVHRALEHLVSGLELARKRILRRTDDGVSEILLPSTGPYSQQLDPDSEPGCALVQAARGTRVGSAQTVEAGRMPLADSTDERLALLREPLFRRPQRTRQSDNFFKSSYHYGTTFHAAAALLSQIAVLVSNSSCLHECSRGNESREIATEIVQNFHAGMCSWHHGEGQQGIRSHCLLYSIAAVLLSCMYPSAWTIGKRLLPECYGRAAAICANRLDRRIQAHTKRAERECSVKRESEEDGEDEDAEDAEDEDEWEAVDAVEVPAVNAELQQQQQQQQEEEGEEEAMCMQSDQEGAVVDGYSLEMLLADEPPELLKEARQRWAAFCRPEAEGRCAWRNGVAPLLERMIANNGAPPACPQEIDELRARLEGAVQGAWLVHSPDGFQRPPPNCPCSDVDFGKIRSYHVEPVYVGGLPGQPALARTGLVGMRPFQFRQILAELMGAHLPRVDPLMKEEVNVAANEGQMCERTSCNPLIEGEHGEERTIKAISPAQCDRDTDCFGSREERKRACRAQCEAYDLNFQLLEPMYVHLSDPRSIEIRMRGRSGDSDRMQAVVRSRAASNAGSTWWERDAEYLLSKASTSEASAQSIRALHRGNR